MAPWYFVAALGVALLMVIHEAGHFFAARAYGMRVTKFSIGFGPHVFPCGPRRGVLLVHHGGGQDPHPPVETQPGETRADHLPGGDDPLPRVRADRGHEPDGRARPERQGQLREREPGGAHRRHLRRPLLELRVRVGVHLPQPVLRRKSLQLDQDQRARRAPGSDRSAPAERRQDPRHRRDPRGELGRDGGAHLLAPGSNHRARRGARQRAHHHPRHARQ
jgi:hypothetical protein